MEQDITPEDLKLSSKYLQYIVFASESAYIGLYDGKDICKFMALAINDLISPVDKIVFEFKKAGQTELGFLTLEDAFKLFTEKGKCQNLIVTRSHFQLKKLTELFHSLNLNRQNQKNNVLKCMRV